MMSRRDAIFPAGRQALYEINRYSAAIRSGDLLFVSGQVKLGQDPVAFRIANDTRTDPRTGQEEVRQFQAAEWDRTV